MPDRRAIRLFASLCVLVAAAVVGYGFYARGGGRAGGAAEAAPAADGARVAAVRAGPHVLFRVTALGPAYGRVGVVPLDDPGAAPVITGLACERVHASGGEGLCLQAARGLFTTYRAVAFDAGLAERHVFPLAGAPSRTRVAAGAPLAASTVFVSGDSYAAGGFSTRTVIYDLRTNTVSGDLESFTTIRDGSPFKHQDFNFWGVTFTGGGDRFYATLQTGGDLHLVEGSLAARTLTVIGPDVECPSLSPDGTRLAYKARAMEGGRVFWRVRVLDLATKAIVPLRETRNVDDQVEWLDDGHILYALPRETAGSGSSDVWAVPADGAGEPRLLIPDAFSPAVVR